jgi:crotonobetainyl-CoA:carnitine CoA-transferase CaiB-like acyl-CoA transferase
MAHDGNAFTLSKTPYEIRWAGPCLGEHNEYVYTKILGMSESEFDELLVEGVFE